MANVVEIIFRGVDQVSRNTSRMSRSLASLSRVALGVGAALAAAFSFRELGRAADAMTLVENKIRLVTDSVDELNTVQEKLFRVAQETRSAFAPTIELYARVARSTKALGISQQDVINLTRTVNQTIQISGATAQEASAGVIQFAQALASGQLRGDELRSVMEQLSGLSIVLARGLGVTIGELRGMAEAGELTAETIIRVLKEQAPQVAAEFEQITPTIAGSFQTLQNSLAAFVGDLDDATEASGFFAGSLRAVAAGVDALRDAITTTELEQLQEQLAELQESAAQIRKTFGETRRTRDGILISNAETDKARLDAINAALLEVVKRISEIQNKAARKLSIDPITVDSDAIKDRLDKAIEDFDADYKEKINSVWQHFTDRYATAEQQVAAEMARFNMVDHLFPPEEQERIREAIRSALFEGLEPININDIVDTEAMDRQLEEVLTSTDEWGERMKSIADEAARSMQRAFSDFFFDPFQDGLKGMVAGFLNAVRRMLADEAAIRFFNLLSGKSGGSSSGGLLGGILKGIFGGGATGPLGPPLAHGGPTMGGLLHPVNEREPEFLLTRGRSEVVPLSKLAAAGAGGGRSVFSPNTTFNLMTAPLSRDQLEEFSQSREEMMFAKFKRMLRDDGLD